MTQILDGKAIAARLRADIAAEVPRLGFTPGLAVVLVGEDPASQVYVSSKGKATLEVGFRSIEHKLPATTSEAELLALVTKLNGNPDVDGILVQFPLPAHINADRVIAAIDPDKDVDGFHPINAGRLATGLPGLVPCTPRGSVKLLQEWKRDLSGLHAIVVGRSNIVGKPVAQLLLQANCTVTIAHSKTRDLAALCRTADVLVAAIGRPEALGREYVKEGAAVIDVGINRITGPDGKNRLVGDVAYAEVAPISAAITPVPGGVGPMTIACLLENTLIAAKRRRAL
jgi:methylenetetrahydrofolate dehydrogenase (NADP+)/methenyltetrahydrofolate cyclohydrolase